MSIYTCGLKYRAKHSVSEIEAWLDKNCQGAWDVKLESIDDSGPHIVNLLAILFEKASDRDRFRASFSGKQG